MQANKTVWMKGRLVAALLSCVAVVGLAVGCNLLLPGGVTDACTGNSCDDGNLCTTDTCTVGSNGEAVCANDAVDCGSNSVCDPNAADLDSACVECVADADCDDAAFCNGSETCDSNGTCVAGTDEECGAFDCNEDTDACEECNDATDCSTGGFCDGDPTCDSNGVCGFSGDPCAAGETCDEDLNTCGANVPPPADCTSNGDCTATQFCNSNGECEDYECTVDADCDNGDFCNGDETCDTNGFTCVSGTAPCAADETCDDDLNTCGAASSKILVLTTGTDSGPAFVGSSSADAYDGSLFLSGGGTFIQTLGNSDSLDGGDGTDVLTAQFNPTADATVTPASLANIEVFNFEVTTGNPQTVSMVNAPQATTINFDNSATNGGDLLITNLPVAPTAFGMTNTTEAFTVTIDKTKLTGTSDACTLTLSGVSVTDGELDVTFQPSGGVAASGYETITVNSIGGVANEIDSLVDGDGNSLSKVIFTGSQDITIDNTALDSTVSTIDASTATGKVTVNATAAAGNVTFTGGSGDDSLDISGTYTTSDTIDGGAGTDTLRLTSNEAEVGTTTQTNVSNIETLYIDTITSGDIDVSKFGASNLRLTVGSTSGDTLTLPTGGILTVDSVDPAGSNTLAVAGTDTSSDTLTLELDNIAWTTNVAASTFETLNIVSETGANSIGGTTALANAAAVDTINVSGTQAMTFTGVITANVLDASTLTGALTITAAVANQMTITGGTAADTLRGGTSADTISGGDGVDTIRGDGGADLLTGGAGNDIFNGDNADTDETVADTITDFDAATSTTSADSFVYDISSIEAVTGVTDLVDTSVNSASGGDGTFVQLGSDGATVANADIVGLIGDYTNATTALAAKTSWTITYEVVIASLADNDAFLVAYTSGSNVRIAVAVNNGVGSNSDSIDTLFDIAILQGVSLSNLDSGDFTAQGGGGGL